MADRLTQLQDAVNVQAQNLTNSVGLLQQSSDPESFPEFESFLRESSTAYQQVLAQAGISLDPQIDENDVYNKDKSSPSNNNNNNNLDKENKDKVDDDNEQNRDPFQTPKMENSKLFAKLITKTAKDIACIIDSLPEKMEPGIQEGHIARLELENREEAKLLEEVIARAENLLHTVQEAMEDIAQNQMTMKKLEAQMLTIPMLATNNNNNNNIKQQQQPSIQPASIDNVVVPASADIHGDGAKYEDDDQEDDDQDGQ